MAHFDNRRNFNRPNLWGMIQNVLIASLNKGQFLIGIVGLCIIIMIIKLSPEDTKDFLDDLLVSAGDWKYMGWLLGVFSTAGWFFTSKRMRTLHTKEISRMSEEKKKLQQSKIPKKLGSSNKKK
ncbi:hypothetical protein CMU20_17520 [Elizabethkingia anophelis]|nr:hypothetical protein [Elizabethkingia anophelis]